MSLLSLRCNEALINWVIIIGQEKNEMQLKQLNFFSVRLEIMTKFRVSINASLS